MEFTKYQHVERIGTSGIQDLTKGLCHIFPKIDGTNGSVWPIETDIIGAGSRKRNLSIESDNAGFYEWAVSDKKLNKFFNDHPTKRLFGEFLIPHTLRTYRDDAWRKFYVFDVVTEDGVYVNYESYHRVLEDYGIDYIPLLDKIQDPSMEQLSELIQKNDYLIKDGDGIGEGIVIKRYDYKNKYGRVTWGKILSGEFKAKAGRKEKKVKGPCEEEVCNRYVTEDLVKKEYSKILLENPDIDRRKLIPRILNTVFHCLIEEEMWNIVTQHKKPTINFKDLYFYSSNKVREILPDLFCVSHNND